MVHRASSRGSITSRVCAAMPNARSTSTATWLGFSLVKKTVNFDDPHSYHLYFGDETGSPRNTADVLRVAAGRPRKARPRDVRVDSASRAQPSARSGSPRTRRAQPPALSRRPRGPTRRGGAREPGSVRGACSTRARRPLVRPAGRRRDGADRRRDDPPRRLACRRRRRARGWRERLVELGLRPTACRKDRKYFRSVYFRMPDGILVEIATDGQGFVDEPPGRRSAGACRSAVAGSGALDARAGAFPDQPTRAARMPAPRRAGGGIGRRARLRAFVPLGAWRFKSLSSASESPRAGIRFPATI